MWKRIFFLLGFLINSMMIYSQPPNYWRLVTNHRPAPVANAGPDLYLSVSQPSVQALASTDNPSNSVGWSGPNSFTSSVLQPWFNTIGTYTLTVTNSYNCSASDQLLVRMANPLDTFWTVAQLPTLCFGQDSIILDDFVSQPGKGSFSGPGVVGRIAYANPSGTSNIDWIVDQKTLPISRTVNPQPNVWVYEDSVIRCPGRVATLGAVGETVDVYRWSKLLEPNVVLSTNPLYQITVDSEVAYLLQAGKIYNGKTCYVSDTTLAVPISAEFTYKQDTSQGQFGTIYPSEFEFHALFTAPGYSWKFGDFYATGGGTSNVRDPKYNYSQKGDYMVILSILGCDHELKDTAIVTVNRLIVTSIDEQTQTNPIQLYPNPAVDKIKLSFGETRISYLQVFDMSGRIVSMERPNETFYELDVSSYRSGVYLVKVFDEQGRGAVGKFMKQ